MPQTCSICKHPKRNEIEQAIRDGKALRDIAGQHGTNKNAIDRHKKHMVSLVAEAVPAIIPQEVVAKSLDIIDDLRTLKGKLETALETAIDSGNIIALTSVSRELRGVMDTLIKIAIVQKETEAAKHNEISEGLNALIAEVIG